MDGQKNNYITWNALKFCVLRLGKNDEIKMNTCLLTPEFEEVIEAKEVVKDLGIMIDDSLNFNTQVETAAIKTKINSGWVLRTFKTRSIEFLRSIGIAPCYAALLELLGKVKLKLRL